MTDHTATEPLKPCPFCGGKPDLHACDLMKKEWAVQCLACGAYPFIWGSPEGAAIAWNRRPIPGPDTTTIPNAIAIAQTGLNQAVEDYLKVRYHKNPDVVTGAMLGLIDARNALLRAQSPGKDWSHE